MLKILKARTESKKVDDIYQSGSLKLVFTVQDTETLWVDSNERIHSERSDWAIYATRMDLSDVHACEERVQYRFHRLFHNFFVFRDTGIEEVKLRPYRLIIRHSRAVDAKEIIRAVTRSIEEVPSEPLAA